MYHYGRNSQFWFNKIQGQSPLKTGFYKIIYWLDCQKEFHQIILSSYNCMSYLQMHIKCSMKECREVKKIPSSYVHISVQNVLTWNVNHWKSLEVVFLYLKKWYQIATTLQYFWIYSLLPAGLFKLWNNLVIEQWNCQKQEYRSFEGGNWIAVLWVIIFSNTVTTFIATVRDSLHCCDTLFLSKKKVELDQLFSQWWSFLYP